MQHSHPKAGGTWLWLETSVQGETQSGVLRDKQWLAYDEREGQSLETLYASVRANLKHCGLKLEAIDGFILDTGPGSVLGIRISIATLRAWLQLPAHKAKAVFTYASLHLAATKIKVPAYTIISESIHGKWNTLQSTSTAIEVLDAEQLKNLKARNFYHLRQRKHQKPPPVPCKPIDLRLKDHPQKLLKVNLTQGIQGPEIPRPQTSGS